MLGIVLQDEHFLDRPRWDLDKQTDVVLATYLLDRASASRST